VYYDEKNVFHSIDTNIITLLYIFMFVGIAVGSVGEEDGQADNNWEVVPCVNRMDA
jgi:hypothetical protein